MSISFKKIALGVVAALALALVLAAAPSAKASVRIGGYGNGYYRNYGCGCDRHYMPIIRYRNHDWNRCCNQVKPYTTCGINYGNTCCPESETQSFSANRDENVNFSLNYSKSVSSSIMSDNSTSLGY